MSTAFGFIVQYVVKLWIKARVGLEFLIEKA